MGRIFGRGITMLEVLLEYEFCKSLILLGDVSNVRIEKWKSNAVSA